MRQWMGDSSDAGTATRSWSTTNFTDKTRFRGSSETCTSSSASPRRANTLLYRFTVDDPATWTKPWTGEYAWPLTKDHIYEYACHEANYALEGVLRGARFREAEEAKKGK